jgi:acyl-coenzyme A synthetase/AMP-(fatty) acid ligase
MLRLCVQIQHLPGFRWVDMDENAACGLCYTSGTTGHPSGCGVVWGGMGWGVQNTHVEHELQRQGWRSSEPSC